MRTSNALRHIEHIASLGMTPHIAIPEMLRALHSVVPMAQSGFFWVGPSGAVLDAYAPRAPGGQDVFVDARRCDFRAGGGRAALHVGADRCLHLTVTARGDQRAVLTLQRTPAGAPFAERERRMLLALAPYFGRALEATAT